MLSTDPFKTVDEAAEFHAAAYRRFIFLRGIFDPSPVDIVNPSAFKLKRPRRSFLEEHHAFTAELFVQSAANRVNSLCRLVMSLQTWQMILPEYEATERLYLEVEFVAPILQLAMAEVGGIKNQIAFSVAKASICMESGKLNFDIPRDDQISPTTWEIWTTKWSHADDFGKALRAVNSREFRAVSRDYRNRRAHTLAPSFIGIIPAHIVTRDQSGWQMQIRFEEKLEIGPLVSALITQHVSIVALIEAMRALLRARFNRPT
jgi:hypothetical protein